MSTLLTTYSITTILLILIVAIPAIIKAITWIINIVKKHHANLQEAFDDGHDAAQEEEAVEERFEAGEDFMKKLDERETTLEQIMKDQQEQIGLLRSEVKTLTDSDNLNIKQDIKKTWVRVVQQGHHIDYHDLDVLRARFEIYKERGGNSWAAQMMNEINAHAAITQVCFTQEQDK